MTKSYTYIKDHPKHEALAMAQCEVMEDFPGTVYRLSFVLNGE